MTPVNPSSLTVSTDGTCGPDKGTRCATGCCSQYGNCGTTPEHCSGACQHAFGTGCTDADVAGSWQSALSHGVTDKQAGGQYFFDAPNKLFWTWDTPELMKLKMEKIVKKYKLGGVMAWSLGEDSFDWSHIHAMADSSPKAAAISKATPGNKKISHPPVPRATPYGTVFVDGTPEGPRGDHAVQPGAPADFAVPAPQGEMEASTPQQEHGVKGLAQGELPFSPEYLQAMGKGRVSREGI
jgi:chitinase